MARSTEYGLPGYNASTLDHDTYIRAWQEMAKPVEEMLGLTLMGYDPDFLFIKGNPQSTLGAPLRLPVWFVRDLSEKLRAGKV